MSHTRNSARYCDGQSRQHTVRFPAAGIRGADLFAAVAGQTCSDPLDCVALTEVEAVAVGEAWASKRTTMLATDLRTMFEVISLPAGWSNDGCPASVAMVAQPVQQQQARARAARPVRGERRVVTVRASDTGEAFNVLTSVPGTGFAMVEDIPSNEHRAGELRGMLLTHGAIRKAVVFASMEEGAAYAEQSRRKGWGHRYSPAAIVADPAVV